MDPDALMDQLGYEVATIFVVYRNRLNSAAPPIVLMSPQQELPVDDLRRTLVDHYGMPEAVVNAAMEQL